MVDPIIPKLTTPIPVAIETPNPIPVQEINPIEKTPKPRVDVVETELALKTSGQRKVNLLWEVTQALIAGTTVGMTLYVSMKLTLYVIDKPDAPPAVVASVAGAFLLLSNITNLVIGFYFGRTNHQRTGGVGSNEEGR